MVSALLLLFACATPVPEGVTTARVDRGPLVYRASLYGEFHAVKSEPIYAPRTGDWSYFTVETVLDDGTEVKEGDVVLTFQRGPTEDEVQSAKNDLDVARAELEREKHKLEVERVELVLEQKRRELALEKAKLFVVEGTQIISELELQKARLDVARAEVELELASESLDAFGQKRETALEVQRLGLRAAQTEFDEKTARLENMDVRAPTSGVVYGPYVQINWRRTKVVPGAVASPGDQLLEIPDLSELEVHVYARQRDAVMISEGDKASVVPTARPDQVVAATVLRKESFATTRNERMGTETPDGNLKEVLVVLKLERTPEGIKPGGTARVALESVLAEEVVRVPMAALTEGARGVTVIGTGGDEQSVEIGKTTPHFAEVLGGLEPGDEVRLGSAAKRTAEDAGPSDAPEPGGATAEGAP